jgi:serine/threonine-protein kinase
VSAELQIGKQVGNYVITELLGEGGMSAVFLARHPQIGRRVAIKMVDPNLGRHPEVCERFLSEARLIARIEHPNVIDIYDFGQTKDGQLYYVMELLKGQELAAVMKQQGRIAPHTIWPYLEQICDGLQAAHDHGVIHRDLKPENIFIIEGKRLSLKILDFGIAKALDAELGSLSKTAKGVVMGTPLTISPEQAAGYVDKICPATDLYALGVILYWMLTGQPPFHSRPPAVVLAKHITDEPAPLLERVDSLPEAVAEVVHRCLMKEPEARFASATELASAYKRALGITASSTAFPPAPEVPPLKAFPAAPEVPPLKSVSSPTEAAASKTHPGVGSVGTKEEAERPEAPAAGWVPPSKPARTEERPPAPEPARPKPAPVSKPAPAPKPAPLPKPALEEPAAKPASAEAPAPRPPAGPEPASIEDDSDLLGALVSTGIEVSTEPDDSEPELEALPEPELEPEPEPEPADSEKEDLLSEYADGPEPEGLGADLDHDAPPGLDHDPEYVPAMDSSIHPMLREEGVVAVRGADGELEPFIEQPTMQKKLGTWIAVGGGGVAVIAAIIGLLVMTFSLSSDPEPSEAGDQAKQGDKGPKHELYPLGHVSLEEHKQALSQALKLGPNDPLAGKIEQAQPGRIAGAVIQELISATESKGPGARLALGRLLVRLDRAEQAVKVYKAAIESAPKDPGARVGLGEALHAQGKLAAAISHYKAVLDGDPRHGRARFRLGEAKQGLQSMQEALSAFEAVIRDNEALAADAHYKMGEIFFGQKSTSRELQSYMNALKIDPKHVRARVSLGFAYGRLHRYEEALKELDQAIDLDPKNATARLYRGTVLYNSQQPDQAIAAYREAIRLKPGFAKAHYYLGQAYQNKGDNAAAVKHYKAAIAADPDYEPAVLALAKLQGGK